VKIKDDRFNFVLFCLLALICPIIFAYPVTDGGNQLGAYLNSLDVTHKWLPGHHVDWMTGEPDNVVGGVTKSHCSAFVASATAQLSIYILRPPAHSELLLANAQYDWLNSQSNQDGWVPVDSGMRAQQISNQGCLVVVAFHNPDSKKPGHIAIVRPSDKSDADLQNEGPEIIQAGLENYNSTSVLQGFSHHITSAQDNTLIYYRHNTAWCTV